ncbi:MAG TPA: hypothetical protein PLY93_08410, partial [Turneriella sp.]|nr:hypothetical protein [Turneriella sp.]
RYVPEALAIVALPASVIAIYSAHFIYHYIERIPTMLLMLGLMSLTLFYARRIRAQALTSVLFVGFFALPVIHSHNINETAAYFTYLFAVNILYTALVYFSLLRREHTLSPHTLWSVAAGNALSLLGWAQKFSEYSIIPLLFCAVTFTLLLWSAHQSQWSTDERSDKVLRNLAVFFVNLLYTVMTPTVLNLNKNFHSDIFALAYLALAALNVTAVDFLALRTRSIAAAATSVVLLLTLAMVIFLHGGAERLALAVFLTAVMYMSARWPDKLVYYVTAYLNLLNLLVVFGSVQSNADNVFLLNWQAATLFTYAAGATYLLTRKLWPSAFNFGTLLAITALLTSFVGIIAELNRLFQDSDTRLLIATLLLAVYALVLLTLGFKRHSVA